MVGYDFKNALKTAFKDTFFYFTLLNLVLLILYAFKNTNYSFFDTIQYHFLFYYVFFIVPFFFACIIGKYFLYTEYPRLIHLGMPLVSLLPFIFIHPQNCGFLSCDPGWYYVLLVVSFLLSFKKSFEYYSNHGDYIIFEKEFKLKLIKFFSFFVLNVLIFISIPFINGIHENNDLIINNLNNYGADTLVEKCSEVLFNNEKKALCLTHASTIMHDEKICIKIRKLYTENDEADRCYKELAAYKNNIEFCNKVLFKDARYECYFSFDPLTDDLCKKITDDDYQINCFSDCENIVDVNIKNACYLNKAKKTKDVSFCNKISFDDLVSECKGEISVDVADCTSFSDVNLKDNCFVRKASKNKDISNCMKISSDSVREECIMDNSVDEAGCKRISNINMKEMCVARLAKDVSVCDGLTKDLAKDNCFGNVAVLNGDLALCKRIVDETKRLLCETNV